MTFWPYGTKFQKGDGATPEVFADIASVIEVVPGEMTRDEIDFTNHSSGAYGYREFMGGLRDAGSYEINGNWDPTNATHNGTTGVLAAFESDDNSNWRLQLPDTLGRFDFVGFVSSYKIETPLEEQGKISVTVKVSGRPIFTESV
jgi:hypothetical protein